VRRSLGYKMIGDTSDAVWGVMDIFPRTNFPDVRKKAHIRSAAGNLLIIPREGGSMVRFYIQLPGGTNPKNVKLEDLQSAAKAIFSGFEMDFSEETFWWSAYSIGQRLADNFSKDNRVFLAGDACHTHSPKAGQGMNLSLADGYNLGWKLATVLKGLAGPELLETYVSEREPTAADLIAFDREITSMLKSESAGTHTEAAKVYSDYFIKSAKYTAGLTTTYPDSTIINAQGSVPELAKNVTIGSRFPSAQAVRLSDARAIQLSKALNCTGRWRIMVFAGDITKDRAKTRLDSLSQFLSSDLSPIVSVTALGADPDSIIEPILVLHGKRTELEDANISVPDVFTPVTGRHKMRGTALRVHRHLC
jgi:phenol 2-monooxygenase